MRRRYSTIFYLEQWIALLLAVACMAVCLWALLDGRQVFSSIPPQHPMPALGWTLTLAVALIGTRLARFAFYTPRPESAEEVSLREGMPVEGPLKSDARVTSRLPARKGKR